MVESAGALAVSKDSPVKTLGVASTTVTATVLLVALWDSAVARTTTRSLGVPEAGAGQFTVVQMFLAVEPETQVPALEAVTLWVATVFQVVPEARWRTTVRTGSYFEVVPATATATLWPQTTLAAALIVALVPLSATVALDVVPDADFQVPLTGT